MRLEEQLARMQVELTRLQQAEADARELRERAEALIDHIPFMAWMKGTDGAFLAVNEPFAVACGRSRAWILGRTDHELWPAEHAARYTDDDRRVIATRERVHVEEPIAEASGTKWFETFKAPVFDCDGRVVATVGLARDITDRKSADEQRRLLELRIQRAQKLESLGLLAGGLAHDFNNLLVGVLSNSELALRHLARVPGAERAIERVEDVRLAALRAAELTHQMLAYAGRGRFVVKPISLNEVVRELPPLLQGSIGKDARLELALAPLAPVHADVTQMRQVIMNLIINASDALEGRAGTIRVATGMQALGETSRVDAGDVSDLPPGEYVYVEVSDDGCGMDEETRARLFEPFYSTKPAGRGLGLSAVQGIVRGHHGGLVVESEVGRGTTIRVLFPSSDLPVEPLSAERDGTLEGWRGSGLVLLVEDDDGARASTQRTLEELGFEVLSAPNGRTAVELFERERRRVRVVLLDMTLPDLGGEQVFERLRASRGDVRIVLSSGYGEHDARALPMLAQAAGFLQKPASVETLCRKLRAALAE